MLTILLATDDSSRQPTRHLCSFPPPLRLKILNIMGHFWLVRGSWHIEELNFSTILFPFLPLVLSSFLHLVLSCSSSRHNVNPLTYSPTDITPLLCNFHLQELSVNKERWFWTEVEKGRLISEHNPGATQVNIISLSFFSCGSQPFRNTEVISLAPPTPREKVLKTSV